MQYQQRKEKAELTTLVNIPCGAPTPSGPVVAYGTPLADQARPPILSLSCTLLYFSLALLLFLSSRILFRSTTHRVSLPQKKHIPALPSLSPYDPILDMT